MKVELKKLIKDRSVYCGGKDTLTLSNGHILYFDKLICTSFVKKTLGKTPRRINVEINDRKLKDSVVVYLKGNTVGNIYYTTNKRYENRPTGSLYLKMKSKLNQFLRKDKTAKIYVRIIEAK